MLKSKLESILKGFKDHYEKMEGKYYKKNDRLSNYGEYMGYVCLTLLRRLSSITDDEISYKEVMDIVKERKKIIQHMIDEDKCLNRRTELAKFHEDLLKATNVLEKRLKTVYSKSEKRS